MVEYMHLQDKASNEQTMSTPCTAVSRRGLTTDNGKSSIIRGGDNNRVALDA